MVDEEAIGSVDRRGCGAKILRGDGALDQYIRRTNVMNLRVRCCQARNSNTVKFLPYIELLTHDHLCFAVVLCYILVVKGSTEMENRPFHWLC